MGNFLAEVVSDLKQFNQAGTAPASGKLAASAA
jgi:hypothetical protein